MDRAAPGRARLIATPPPHDSTPSLAGESGDERQGSEEGGTGHGVGRLPGVDGAPGDGAERDRCGRRPCERGRPDHDHQHRHGRDALGDGGRRRRLPPQPATGGRLPAAGQAQWRGRGRVRGRRRRAGRHHYRQPGQRRRRGEPQRRAGGGFARDQPRGRAFDGVGDEHQPAGALKAACRPKPQFRRAAGARRDQLGRHVRRSLIRRLVRRGECCLHQWPQRHRPVPPAGVLIGPVWLLRGIPGQDRWLLRRVRPQHGWRHQRSNTFGQQRVPRRRRGNPGAIRLGGIEGRSLPSRWHPGRAQPHQPR